jgi:hypothetical protein
MSGLGENVESYMHNQYKNVKSVIGDDKIKRLRRVYQRFNNYSNTPINIFHIYRMFYIL